MADHGKASIDSGNYRRVLKSTSLIGGASIINILIGMVRIKFVAVLLGPSGVGLIAIYSSITGMVATVAGMGINTSGVRQIVKAFANGDELVVARTIKTLRRTVWLTGTLGFLGMVLAAWPLSKVTFGSSTEVLNLALLGSTILLGSVASGQACLLQGSRRIKEVALISIFGALNGTLISIPCYYIWGQQGIVPSLILCAVAGVVTSWWFSRRITVKPIVMAWRESADEAGLLLRFGLPVMLTGLLSGATVYFIRIILIRDFGLDGVGIYQAAFNLSGVLAGFVLSAMGTDYYPRLTAVADDPDQVRREINSQTEIALLLATPALAATLVFAPLAIALFYSTGFEAAIDILRWAVFGVFGRVCSWPLGFLLLAKGKSVIYLIFETLANVLHLGLIWFCTQSWGLPGTGVAFILLYIIYTILLYGWGWMHLNHKLWTKGTLLHVLGLGGMLALIGLTVTGIKHDALRWAISLSACALVSGYCIQRLSEQAKISWQTIKERFTRRTV